MIRWLSAFGRPTLWLAALAGGLQALSIAWPGTGQAHGWLQVLSLIIGGIARMVTTPQHPLRLDAGFSLSGWLAVILTFVLARVFDAGCEMRDDLAGTV